MVQETSPSAATRPSVLIIDDDEFVRDTLKAVLEDAGYEVHTAGDGNAGLALYQSRDVDVVVTDILMPDKEGIETIFELRARAPGLRIIAISGGGRVAARRFLDIASKFGADYVLSKPIRNEELLAAVRCCLDGSAEDERAPPAKRAAPPGSWR